MKVTWQRIACKKCSWYHEELDTESAIPEGLFNSFSDPEGLSRILKEQQAARLEAAFIEHRKLEHPEDFN